MPKDNERIKKRIRQITDIVIVILVAIGFYLTFTFHGSGDEFQMSGIMCLRYFTVQSNLFAGITAAIALFYEEKATKVLKLMSATATGLTFTVVVLFLGPLYGYGNMYKDANLYFHLIVPLLAMADYIFFPDVMREMKWKVLSALLTLAYGFGYILNILINGFGGAYPNNNDFYFFVRWGWGVAMVIFAVLVLVSFGIANLLSGLNRKIGGGSKMPTVQGETDF